MTTYSCATRARRNKDLALLTDGGGRDGGAAAEGLEARVDDPAGPLVDADLQLHDVPARRRADDPRSDVRVVLVQGPHVARIVVVVHHPLVVSSAPARRHSSSDRGRWLAASYAEESPARRAQHHGCR
jgi:hypothetical protein